jgi:hypothetical protein
MLLNTRRRVLGLLAGVLGLRLIPFPGRAEAKTDCFATQAIGPWKGVATQAQAGARGPIQFANLDKCALRGEISVAANFDSRLVLYGDQDKLPLPKNYLIKPEHRLIVRDLGGKTLVDDRLCGNCTDIHDDKVSIVLPLACAPLFQSSPALELAVKLADKDECSAKLDCDSLRKALGWASQKQADLARQYEKRACTPPPQGCFITTACCELLGLGDECFELRTLRRYRDDVLAKLPGGEAAIARYYAEAPLILHRLRFEERPHVLLRAYARFILPAAVAARFSCSRLAFRLYARMMQELAALR